ncbi:hypothetical protein CUMW_151450 [Citrus unshiu]|nr:hypothetical protein CUMW_151450 [Citrus unshiu]
MTPGKGTGAGTTSKSNEITAPLIEASSAEDPSVDVENSPIEQVALTVPTTDDPSLQTFTFRTSLIMHPPFISQPILLVPPRASLYLLHLRSNRRRSTRLSHGQNSSEKSLLRGTKI